MAYQWYKSSRTRPPFWTMLFSRVIPQRMQGAGTPSFSTRSFARSCAAGIPRPLHPHPFLARLRGTAPKNLHPTFALANRIRLRRMLEFRFAKRRRSHFVDDKSFAYTKPASDTTKANPYGSGKEHRGDTGTAAHSRSGSWGDHRATQMVCGKSLKTSASPTTASGYLQKFIILQP